MRLKKYMVTGKIHAVQFILNLKICNLVKALNMRDNCTYTFSDVHNDMLKNMTVITYMQIWTPYINIYILTFQSFYNSNAQAHQLCSGFIQTYIMFDMLCKILGSSLVTLLKIQLVALFTLPIFIANLTDLIVNINIIS